VPLLIRVFRLSLGRFIKIGFLECCMKMLDYTGSGLMTLGGMLIVLYAFLGIFNVVDWVVAVQTVIASVIMFGVGLILFKLSKRK